METFQKQLHLPVTRIDDSKRILGLLKVCQLPAYLSVCLSVCPQVYVCPRVCMSVCVCAYP